MRVNVYAEEMTNRVQIVEKTIDGTVFTGLRFYLELPVTVVTPAGSVEVKGPFIHHEGDDDSSAVTFWGKRDLRAVLGHALRVLDEHYEERERRRLGPSRDAQPMAAAGSPGKAVAEKCDRCGRPFP